MQDPAISMLCTALVKSGTVSPMQRSHVMPVEPFTDLFRGWPNNSELSIKQLRLKAITLFAITAMLRPSDIAPKSVIFDPSTGSQRRITFNKDQIVFTDNGDAKITFLGTKNDTTRTGFQVILRKATDSKIDPVRTLKDYIARTDAYRHSSSDPVFLTLAAPYRALTADSIASILQDSIRLAGLGDRGFTAKDFRPTGATVAANAANSQQDADKIVKLGRWKDKNTFLNHYWHSEPPVHYTDTVLSDT